MGLYCVAQDTERTVVPTDILASHGDAFVPQFVANLKCVSTRLTGNGANRMAQVVEPDVIDVRQYANRSSGFAKRVVGEGAVKVKIWNNPGTNCPRLQLGKKRDSLGADDLALSSGLAVLKYEFTRVEINIVPG